MEKILAHGESQRANNGANLNSPNGQPTRNGTSNGYPDAFTGAEWRGGLSEKHRHALEEESAISPDAIEARGYSTANDPHILELHGYPKTRRQVPSLVIPLWNWEGERAGVALRLTIPRTDKNGKEVKYDLPEKSAPTLDVSPLTRPLLADLETPLVITEGAKKADCAASNGFPAINLNGVWGFVSKGVPLPDWEHLRPYLRGRVVFIAYDSDVSRKWGVETAMRRLEALLRTFGAVVKVIYLSDGPEGEKTGLDDFFARGGTREQLLLLARDLEPVEESNRKRREKEKADKRAKIEEEGTAVGVESIETNDRHLSDITDDLARALSKLNGDAPTLFHGATGLVRLTVDKDGADIIKPASLELLQGISGDAANWIATSERGGAARVFPPKNVCAVYLERPEKWRNIPPLENIVNAPFFAPNGTLCDKSGYHPDAQTWLSLPLGFELPDTSPTPENIEAARGLILEKALAGVAFADAASRAHAVAVMLLPLVRRMIRGATPIHLFDAPVQSSGKSYAARLVILPHTTPVSMVDIQHPEEWEKSIFTAFLEGRTHLFFDNITGRLNSPTLASYITEPEKRQRVLGANTSATVRTWGATWIATSNNASLSGDAVSRVVKIRLDTGMEAPESRRFDFDPETFILENRAQVFGALLTLVNAWIANGKTPYTRQKHRFAQWSQIIGGILETAGIEGFLDNLEAERENMAPEKDAWREFVCAWWEIHANNCITAKELIEVAVKCEGLSGIIGEKEGKAKRLGDLLSRKRDQIFSDFQIQKEPKTSKLGVKWRLLPLNHPQNPEKGATGATGATGSGSPTWEPKNQESKKDNLLEKNALKSRQLETVAPVAPVAPFRDSGADSSEELPRKNTAHSEPYAAPTMDDDSMFDGEPTGANK
jgi:hypothetical protein